MTKRTLLLFAVVLGFVAMGCASTMSNACQDEVNECLRQCSLVTDSAYDSPLHRDQRTQCSKQCHQLGQRASCLSSNPSPPPPPAEE